MGSTPLRERNMFHPDEQREELPGGELRLSFRVGSNGLDAVARFCLAYAGNCRVESPPALKKIIRDRLTKGLKDHGW
jgi:predicted DNA-binding transcriptional regulator YafY